MLTPDFSKITVDEIQLQLPIGNEMDLHVLRLDKIHPVISGNKWFKLKYHLENFSKKDYTGILTFGGAWSNHIIATACACSMYNIKSVGIIRGEKPKSLSPTLQLAEEYGMQLEFLSRETYSQKSNPDLLNYFLQLYPNFYAIPEGGSGKDGEKGMAEILKVVDLKLYTHILCAIGTGTMFRGITSIISPTQTLFGVYVLKGFEQSNFAEANQMTTSDYHFGGYAKQSLTLINFMNDFYERTGITTDFVYTGKLFFAVEDLIKKNTFQKGSKLLVIHSGGLQGNTSLTPNKLHF